MKIMVKAKTGAKETKVVPPEPRLIADGMPTYIIWVKERPIAGQANEAITRALAEYFRTRLSQVHLKSGATSRLKVFDVIGI